MREHDYWREQGKTYKRVFEGFSGEEAGFYRQQEAAILAAAPPARSVLEVGCGFGRITRRMLDSFDIEEYVAFDISEEQVRHTRELCPEAMVFTSSIEQNTDQRCFDLVLAVEVLLHVPPERIGAVMEKLLSLSDNGNILTVDQWPPPPGPYKRSETDLGTISQQRVPFNWYHDYEALWGLLGVPEAALRIIPISDRQVMCVVTGEKS